MKDTIFFPLTCRLFFISGKHKAVLFHLLLLLSCGISLQHAACKKTIAGGKPFRREKARMTHQRMRAIDACSRSGLKIAPFTINRYVHHPLSFQSTSSSQGRRGPPPRYSKDTLEASKLPIRYRTARRPAFKSLSYSHASPFD